MLGLKKLFCSRNAHDDEPLPLIVTDLDPETGIGNLRHSPDGPVLSRIMTVPREIALTFSGMN